MDSKDELKGHEDIGEIYQLSEKQSILPPKIYRMKYLTIEITFEYMGLDRDNFLDWYQAR